MNLRIRAANKNDCRDLWQWRNHPEIRKHFFNTEEVIWEDHGAWFSKIKESNTQIYIVEKGSDKLGVIRFEIKGKYAIVSVNVNPEFLSKGMGGRMIQLGTERFWKETVGVNMILAEIKVDNIASQKAFAKSGYAVAKKKQDVVIYKKMRENIADSAALELEKEGKHG